MSWKEKFPSLSFIAPEFIEHQIQTKTLRFYPISVKSAFRIRSIAQPIAKALASLLGKHDNDVAQKVKTKMRDGKVEDQDIQTEAIPKEIAELRSREREKAISEAVMVLLDPDNSAIIGMLLADSLRDDFPRNVSAADAKEFVDELPAPALTEFLVGLAKANKKVLGPLAEMAGEAMKRSLGGLRGDALPPEPEENIG